MVHSRIRDDLSFTMRPWFLLQFEFFSFSDFRVVLITGGLVILMPKYHLEAYKVSSNFHLPFLLFFLSDSVFIYVLEPECVRIVGRYKPVIKFKKMIINVYLLQQIHPVFALTCFILLIVKIMISNRRIYIYVLIISSRLVTPLC